MTPLVEYALLDPDSRQEWVVPVLREYLPQIGSLPEAEVVWGLWLEGLWTGMDDVLTAVALQALLQDRTASLSLDPKRLMQANLIQKGIVFWRIYLHLLQRVIASIDKFDVITFLFPYAEDLDCRRIIISFIHQLFLENASLIKRFHSSPYPVEMVPWMVEYAPSTLPAQITAAQALDLFRAHLGVNLALKYPLPATQDLCQRIINHCQKYGASTVSDAKESLKIMVLALKAFPNLMPMVAPVLATWTGMFGAEPEFVAATLTAAQQIAQITALVQLPIYRKRQSVL
ncbi:hypothetical protein PSACC_01048 [Paramicrosporidium saccamoebae]|uniref:Uncharacterized protein n=1 Tax=Paramicrosporidium saccamoebae TaxID=1246581 RepID=A0A2H9TN16_9FUNG|nr:hypothetical protein PSACC_01048 [Paramicrosporidium saccamoebae]